MRRAWEQLSVERRATPPKLSDDVFQDWISGRPIFVGSRMDDQMRPSRAAVRARLASIGAEPVMWETITPQDRGPEDAFLEGVDRSDIAVFLTGYSYGRADESGYSPTHKEWNRATDRAIPRLLFEPAGLQSNDRDGRLNDWMASIRDEVSVATFETEEVLLDLLESRLRQIAAGQQLFWVKCGEWVFPATVHRRGGTTAEVEVAGRVRDRALRSTIADAARQGHRAERVTWSQYSERIDSIEVEIRSLTAGEDEVRLVCHQRGWAGQPTPITVSAHGRTAGPDEQVRLWAGQALFGQQVVPRSLGDIVASWTSPDGPSLPEVLARERAGGWLAEGLANLYVVEGLITKFGGHFENLRVGPQTARGLPVAFGFAPNGGQRTDVSGVVSLLERRPS